jgi:magnesium-transporting ATPase (P-type)
LFVSDYIRMSITVDGWNRMAAGIIVTATSTCDSRCLLLAAFISAYIFNINDYQGTHIGTSVMMNSVMVVFAQKARSAQKVTSLHKKGGIKPKQTVVRSLADFGSKNKAPPRNP